MKIDMQLVKDLVAANAPASAILAYLERLEVYAAPLREKERTRKRAYRGRTRAGHAATSADIDGTTTGQPRDIVETSRAKLFRQGKDALLTLNISRTRAGALMTQWLVVVKDDEKFLLETIMNAQKLAVNDAPGWILAQLRGKTSGTAKKQNLGDLCLELGDEARELERKAGISR